MTSQHAWKGETLNYYITYHSKVTLLQYDYSNNMQDLILYIIYQIKIILFSFILMVHVKIKKLKLL